VLFLGSECEGRVVDRGSVAVESRGSIGPLSLAFAGLLEMLPRDEYSALSLDDEYGSRVLRTSSFGGGARSGNILARLGSWVEESVE